MTVTSTTSASPTTEPATQSDIRKEFLQPGRHGSTFCHYEMLIKTSPHNEKCVPDTHFLSIFRWKPAFTAFHDFELAAAALFVFFSAAFVFFAATAGFARQDPVQAAINAVGGRDPTHSALAQCGLVAGAVSDDHRLRRSTRRIERRAPPTRLRVPARRNARADRPRSGTPAQPGMDAVVDGEL